MLVVEIGSAAEPDTAFEKRDAAGGELAIIPISVCSWTGLLEWALHTHINNADIAVCFRRRSSEEW